MINTRYAFFEHYPFAGGYYDQPWRTMQVFIILQNEYRKKINEDLKK